MSELNNFLEKQKKDDFRRKIQQHFPYFDLDNTSEEMLRVLYNYTINEDIYNQKLEKFNDNLKRLEIDISLQQNYLNAQISNKQSTISTYGKQGIELKDINIKNEEIRSNNVKTVSNNYNIMNQISRLNQTYYNELSQKPVNDNNINLYDVEFSKLNEKEKLEIDQMITYQKEKLSILDKINEVFDSEFPFANEIYAKNNPTPELVMQERYGKPKFKWIFDKNKRDKITNKLRSGGSIELNYYLGIFAFFAPIFVGIYAASSQLFTEYFWSNFLYGICLGLFFVPLSLWAFYEVLKAIKEKLYSDIVNEIDWQGNLASYAYIRSIQEPLFERLRNIELDMDKKLVLKYKLFFKSYETISCDYSKAYIIIDSNPIINKDYEEIDYTKFINLVNEAKNK